MIDHLKVAAKLLLCRIPRLDPPLERPIFIASTRRSGSTLLMRMIYSQPGLNYVDQPLELWRPHPWRRRLPPARGNRYTTLAGEDRARMRRFLRATFEGRVRFRSQWNPLDPDYSARVERLVVKDLNSRPLLCDIDDWFDLDVVYLVRHPIAVSRSVMMRGWGNTARALLDDEEYCRKIITSEQRRFCRRVLEEEGELEGLVVEWCLGNMIPLGALPDRDWLLLTYEELVARPGRMAGLLAERLDLPDPGRMRERARRPSKTTREESRREIEERGSTAPATRWVGETSESERRRVQEIFDALGVDVYRAAEPSPAPWALHFGEGRLA